jgi:hypothetical protein
VVDVISIHGYLETWDARRAEEYPAFIGAAAALVRETAPRDDLWMAEFGYADWRRTDGRPSEWSYAVKPFEHTADFQAVALLRAHALALGTSVLSLTTWYRVDDLAAGESVIGDDNNKHLGILDVRGGPKPAFAALRLWNQLLDEPVRTIDARAEGAPDAVVRAFEKRSGEVIVLAWVRSAREGENVPDVATVALRLPRTYRSAESLDPRTGASSPEDPALTRVQLRADSVRILRLH